MTPSGSGGRANLDGTPAGGAVKEQTVDKTARLLKSDVAYVIELGHGNFSAGLRLLIKEHREKLLEKV